MSRTTVRNEESRHAAGAGDSYDDIEPWFEKLTALESGDAHRQVVREEIVRRCLPLADHIARKFAGRGTEFEDLQQIARLGLVQAVDRFDVTRGCSFLSFAVPTVMGEVRRYFRDHTWALRVPRRAKELQALIRPTVEALAQRLNRMPTAREIAAELDLELGEVTQALIAANAYQTNSLDIGVGDNDEGTRPSVIDTLGAVEPCYRLLEDAMSVRPLIAALPDTQRRVLIMRFFESKTQSQIAVRLGVSQMQVSRILTKTLNTLREQVIGADSRREVA